MRQPLNFTRYWLPMSNRLSNCAAAAGVQPGGAGKVMVFSPAGSLQLPGIPDHSGD